MGIFADQPASRTVTDDFTHHKRPFSHFMPNHHVILPMVVSDKDPQCFLREIQLRRKNIASFLGGK